MNDYLGSDAQNFMQIGIFMGQLRNLYPDIRLKTFEFLDDSSNSK